MEALRPTRQTRHADGARGYRAPRPARLPESARETALPETAGGCGRITAVEAGRYRIDGGPWASAALGCLVKPRLDDLVQVLRAEDEYFVTLVLQRPEDEAGPERTLELEPGEDRTLSLNAANIRLLARNSMSLYADRGCEIASPDGRLALSARNIFTLATDNLVQQARSSLSQVRNYSVRALEFLHLKGRHQLISAQREVRIDGEHINMG